MAMNSLWVNRPQANRLPDTHETFKNSEDREGCLLGYFCPWKQADPTALSRAAHSPSSQATA